MISINRFNLLSSFDDSDDEEQETKTIEVLVQKVEPEVNLRDFYESFDYDFEATGDNILTLIDSIKKHQKIPQKGEEIDHTKFYQCCGCCCNGTESFYDYDENYVNTNKTLVKAWRRLTGLIQRNSDETPVEELKILEPEHFVEFLVNGKNGRFEKFKDHDTINFLPGLNVSLRTWLSFNTGLKSFNKKTGKDENLKLFIVTYNEFDSDEDYLFGDKFSLQEAQLNIYKRDLHVLRKFSHVEGVDKLIYQTYENIHRFYNNYLNDIFQQIKIFDDFNKVRGYIKRHNGQIAKNRKE